MIKLCTLFILVTIFLNLAYCNLLNGDHNLHYFRTNDNVHYKYIAKLVRQLSNYNLEIGLPLDYQGLKHLGFFDEKDPAQSLNSDELRLLNISLREAWINKTGGRKPRKSKKDKGVGRKPRLTRSHKLGGKRTQHLFGKRSGRKP